MIITNLMKNFYMDSSIDDIIIVFSNLKSQVFECNSSILPASSLNFSNDSNNIVSSNLKLQLFKFCIEFSVNDIPLIAMFLKSKKNYSVQYSPLNFRGIRDLEGTPLKFSDYNAE